MALGPRPRLRVLAATARRPLEDAWSPWPLPPADADRLRELRRRGFRHDGCSSSPDALLRIDFSWACVLHDADYCNRLAERPELVNEAHRRWADAKLRRRIAATLTSSPVFGKLWKVVVPYVYWRAVRTFGARSYGTCGLRPRGVNAGQMVRRVCRHDQPIPAWMEPPPVARRY